MPINQLFGSAQALKRWNFFAQGIPASAIGSDTNAGAVCVEQLMTFQEVANAGTYTATVIIPAGAVVEDVFVRNEALWGSATSATLNVGDGDLATGYISALNTKTTPPASTPAAPASASAFLSHANGGAYKGNYKYYPNGGLITATLVTVGGTAITGQTKIYVVYSTYMQNIVACSHP